ncbi:hypothetical protein CR513_25334, partial [Mucuna pruriens]
DEIVIGFNYKKQRYIEKDHPNLEKEPNSKDQTLRANQVRKFLKEDVQVTLTITSNRMSPQELVEFKR